MAKRKKIRKMKKENMYLSSFYLQLYLVSSSGRAPEETFREGSVQERLLIPEQFFNFDPRDASAAKKTSLLIGKGRMQQKDGKEDHAGGKQLQKL